ncbi:hypothetical protein FisN_24Hh189 [Fistulifera solaris]|uniref:Uncharacterized protein n=1 Tax=Fistulifera solaris TaxID=1519565 RepID=A0A1Z5JUM3_FISSO|nr:hypothetical protein FisN_24Hh189 [Fistulifera solaris]|eukprot:GAX17745.1 hypothetical protein FisN_24Hh189 [Fistulifera solaris]
MGFTPPTFVSLQRQHSRRKRVAFSAQNETIYVPSFVTSFFPNEEEASSRKSDLWYRPADLAGFREEARSLCRRCPSLLSQESLRGLEQRLCPERKRRKYVSNRCIVHASKKRDADDLAALCRKINEWSTELAVIEGARDFDRAWRDERKRLIETDRSRCVRQRLS